MKSYGCLITEQREREEEKDSGLMSADAFRVAVDIRSAVLIKRVNSFIVAHMSL